MTPPDVLPYGSWPSPVTAEHVATAGVRFDGLRASVGPGGRAVAWWSESRSTQGGRSAVASCEPGSDPVEWLPAGLDARTRVHEYGGGAWLPTAHGVVLSHFGDSRLHRVAEPGAEAVALTPDTGATVRYADLSPGPDERSIVCVRDEMARPDADPVRSLVVVDLLDGSETELFAGPHFLSGARVSPDGKWLTWLSWEHPNLPWDETTLWLARLTGRTLSEPVQVAGGQALFQPGWTGDGRLLVVAERGDWWNLHEVVDLTGTPSLRVVREVDQECGLPGWRFGMASWAPLDAGRVVLRHGVGMPSLSVVDLDTGVAEDLGLTMTSLLPELACAAGTLVCAPSDATSPRRVLAVRPGQGRPGQDPVVLAVSGAAPDPAYVSAPRQVQVPGPGGRVVHAYLYPPNNADVEAPTGELPPYLMHVHGGPTGQAPVGYEPSIAYMTSRGIGVVEVDYGGSTGYGRAYRRSLYGQWGVVDVEDCATVARWLGEQQIADPERVVISGGSAGGWTVLSCLTRTDAFAAGASYCGVAELERFARDTHDFESRYLDQLIGPYPQDRDVYVERAPLTHADGITVPVLLLQGSEDKIVPPSQSELFRDAMVAGGIPHAYLLYEGEGHGFRSREAMVHSLGSELAFYGQVLGFDPPDVPALQLVRP